MQEYLSILAAQIVASVPNILTALLIFVLSLYFARVLSNLLKRVLIRHNTASGIIYLLTDILRWTIIVFGAITAVQRFFDVTAFITGLGILGFTVGFALQNVAQNFVSGVILLMQQPFKVGDDVNVLGLDGAILKIDLRTTEMQTLDGRIAILPNADVLSHVIVNYTRAHRRRVDLPLTVAYGASPEQVRAILLGVVKDVPGYVIAPAPEVTFNNFGNSSIELTVMFWVDTSITRVGIAKNIALINVKDAFEKHNIQIPIPAQTVYVKSED
jgi:small-conductance mechanosensitive channel